MNDPNRGTGRTSRALKALPQGAIYVVHSSDFISYCKRFLTHHHCSPNHARVIAINQASDIYKIHGIRCPVEIDHFWWHSLPTGVDWPTEFLILVDAVNRAKLGKQNHET